MSLKQYFLALVGAALVVTVLTALAVRLGPEAGIAVVLVLAAVAATAAFWVYAFIGPLFVQLNEATGQLGQGDLSRIPESVAAPREFGSLAVNVRKVCKGMVKHLGEIVRNMGRLEKDAEQIRSGIEQVVRGGRSQTAGVGEIVGLVQTYENRNRESIELSRLAEQLAFETGDLAVKGAAKIDGVREMIENMQVQVSAVEKAAGDILDTAALIADISRQTNFLALSAAIEAARAGEHGKGFEMVAGQVTRLAEGAGQSTTEISGIVESVHRGVSDTKLAVFEGLERLQRFAASFADIRAKAAAAYEMARQVGAGLNEQGKTAEEVVTNVRSIARVAEETAATVEAAGSVTGEIARVVERFKVVADTYRI